MGTAHPAAVPYRDDPRRRPSEARRRRDAASRDARYWSAALAEARGALSRLELEVAAALADALAEVRAAAEEEHRAVEARLRGPLPVELRARRTANALEALVEGRVAGRPSSFPPPARALPAPDLAAARRAHRDARRRRAHVEHEGRRRLKVARARVAEAAGAYARAREEEEASGSVFASPRRRRRGPR
jgi:hypothetical protein